MKKTKKVGNIQWSCIIVVYPLVFPWWCSLSQWHDSQCFNSLWLMAKILKAYFSNSLYRIVVSAFAVDFIWMPQNLIYGRLILVQVMAWCHQAITERMLTQISVATWRHWALLRPSYAIWLHKSSSHWLTHWGRDKMATISRRHFQMHFPEWKCINFD